jgi:hypothetical protein
MRGQGKSLGIFSVGVVLSLSTRSKIPIWGIFSVGVVLSLSTRSNIPIWFGLPALQT